MLHRTLGPLGAGLLVGLACLSFLAGTGACFDDELEVQDDPVRCHVDAPGIVWYGSEP